MEEGVQLDEVDMGEEGLDFELSDELLLEVLLLYRLLLYYLHRHDHPRPPVPVSIHLYRAMYTLLNFPEPINFYKRKSLMLSDLRGASLVVVDTVSLNSLRLI